MTDRQAQLRASFDEFSSKGIASLKARKYYPALSSFNVARRIASELLSAGAPVPGKELDKIQKLAGKARKKLDESRGKEARGSFLSRLREAKPSPAAKVIEPKKVSLFLFGLDRAGKTTFVEYLSREKFMDHAPTLGINVSNIVLGNVRFEFNDLGGQAAFRGAWMDYWKNQDLLVFMVDAADSGRLAEASDALWSILNRVETAGKPLLVLSNKVDLPHARRIDAIKRAIDFYKIKHEPLAIHEISIKENENLEKPLNFISSIVLEDEEMRAFVSEETSRIAASLDEVYKAYLAEARDLEKAGRLADAMAKVYKAKLVQDELLENGFAGARKKGLRCLDELSRLLAAMNKRGLPAPAAWWHEPAGP